MLSKKYKYKKANYSNIIQTQLDQTSTQIKSPTKKTYQAFIEHQPSKTVQKYSSPIVNCCQTLLKNKQEMKKSQFQRYVEGLSQSSKTGIIFQLCNMISKKDRKLQIEVVIKDLLQKMYRNQFIKRDDPIMNGIYTIQTPFYGLFDLIKVLNGCIHLRQRIHLKKSYQLEVKQNIINQQMIESINSLNDILQFNEKLSQNIVDSRSNYKINHYESIYSLRNQSKRKEKSWSNSFVDESEYENQPATNTESEIGKIIYQKFQSQYEKKISKLQEEKIPSLQKELRHWRQINARITLTNEQLNKNIQKQSQQLKNVLLLNDISKSQQQQKKQLMRQAYEEQRSKLLNQSERLQIQINHLKNCKQNLQENNENLSKLYKNLQAEKDKDKRQFDAYIASNRLKHKDVIQPTKQSFKQYQQYQVKLRQFEQENEKLLTELVQCKQSKQQFQREFQDILKKNQQNYEQLRMMLQDKSRQISTIKKQSENQRIEEAQQNKEIYQRLINEKDNIIAQKRLQLIEKCSEFTKLKYKKTEDQDIILQQINQINIKRQQLASAQKQLSESLRIIISLQSKNQQLTKNNKNISEKLNIQKHIMKKFKQIIKNYEQKKIQMTNRQQEYNNNLQALHRQVQFYEHFLSQFIVWYEDSSNRYQQKTVKEIQLSKEEYVQIQKLIQNRRN